MLKILLFIAAFSANAQCLKFDNAKTSVNWTAFKTPAKAGVNGGFSSFTITPKSNNSSLKKLLVGATFTIDTSSVATKNASRDKKIVANFFDDVKIDGVVKSIKKDMLMTEMTMNGNKVVVPLKFMLKGNSFEAKGTIDVFDFMMHSHLKAINKACKALHEGKTWNDVNISIKTTFGGC